MLIVIINSNFFQTSIFLELDGDQEQFWDLSYINITQNYILSNNRNKPVTSVQTVNLMKRGCPKTR